eukprot:scaffold8143_cov101-Isochrysis_galbana.AAC.1
MASSAQAGCQAPARAQSAGAILSATRVPPVASAAFSFSFSEASANVATFWLLVVHSQLAPDGLKLLS